MRGVKNAFFKRTTPDRKKEHYFMTPLRMLLEWAHGLMRKLLGGCIGDTCGAATVRKLKFYDFHRN